MALTGLIAVHSCVFGAWVPLLLVHALQGSSKDVKEDETKLDFLKNALFLEWPEEKPVCRADVSKALEWRASVSHAEAKGA